MHLRAILLINFFFCTIFLFGQVVPNEFDKKYVPNQNSIFNSLNKKNDQPSSYSSVQIKNSFKFCPTALFRSRIMFYYEREIYKGLSFNLGFGKAFGKDFLQYTYFSAFNSGRTNNNLTPSDILTYSSYSGSSPFIAVHLRLYFSGKTFDGGFVDFNYSHERFDFTLNARIYNWPVNGSRDGSFNMNAMGFGFGYTFTGGEKNNFVHEFFMTGAAKFFTVAKFERIDGTNVNGAPDSFYRKTALQMEARILTAFNIGYAFGFGF